MMKQYTDALAQALKSENYYGALIIALTLPDICRRLENPKTKVGDGYTAWFDKWMKHYYTMHKGPSQTEYVFLTGGDVYALRCALLHQGEFDVSGKPAHTVLDHFKFVIAPPGWTIHCNKTNGALQVQVDIFCNQIIDAVEAWLKSVSADKDVQKRLSTLATIVDGRSGDLSF